MNHEDRDARTVRCNGWLSRTRSAARVLEPPFEPLAILAYVRVPITQPTVFAPKTILIKSFEVDRGKAREIVKPAGAHRLAN